MSKITSYAALTSPQYNDQLVIVDLDDTTMASTGTTKKISLANLNGVAPLFPSGDTTGTTDDANFTAAQAALTNGGIILLAPGTFYTKAGWVLNAQTTAGQSGGNPVCLQGSGGATTLSVGSAASGATTSIYYHRTSSYGNQQGATPNHPAGFIRDLTIEGSTAAAGSVGLDVGDGEGYDVSGVTINTFNSAGSIGFRQNNAVFWTEKCRFRVIIFNCSIAAVIDVNGGNSNSHEYNIFDINMMLFHPGQNGVVVQNAASLGGNDMYIRGNMSSGTATTQGAFAYTSSSSTNIFTLPGGTVLANGTPVWLSGAGTGGFTNNQIYYVVSTSTNTVKLANTIGGSPVTVTVTGSGTLTTAFAALSFIGTDGSGNYSRLLEATLMMKVEGNTGQGDGSIYPNTITLGGNNNVIQQCTGRIACSLNNSALNTGEFTFRGIIVGDSNLSQAFPLSTGGTQTSNPAFPGLNTAFHNYGPDFMVYVFGGTVSSVSINSVTTGATNGSFFVPAGGYITVNGTGAPTTYNWVPATQTQY